MNYVGKLLMSLGIAIYTFIPPLADLATDTHVFHPGWMPHARMHTVWLLGVTTATGLVALYLLWIRKKDTVFNENFAGALAVCVLGSFFLSAATTSFYGGALTDQSGGIELGIMGLDANLIAFSVAAIILATGWTVCKSARG